MSNISAIFQGLINQIFDNKLNGFYIVYLDNNLISTKKVSLAYMETIKLLLKQF